MAIKPKFSVGDHVQWTSEAGRVSGTISKVHTTDFAYKGYTHTTPARRSRNTKSKATKPTTLPRTKALH